MIISGIMLMAILPPVIPTSGTFVMDRIIECESGWDYQAQNPNSSARGLCQFINGTWDYVQKKWGEELDRLNYHDQMYACKRLYQEEGERHWLSSKSCWSK